MRTLTLIAVLAFTGCAHETTTLDRELALKLADRPQVIVAPSAPAPIINVNNYNGHTWAPTAQVTAPVQEPEVSTDPIPLADRHNCTNSPQYNVSGQLTGYAKLCAGGN